MEQLQGEKCQLEAHLTRTEAWGEHLGQWRAVVQSAEVEIYFLAYHYLFTSFPHMCALVLKSVMSIMLLEATLSCIFRIYAISNTKMVI